MRILSVEIPEVDTHFLKHILVVSHWVGQGH